MEKDKVSIIVPIYNCETYIDKCVNSITSQTYKNLEIILVDDGSKDGSPALCDKFAQRDKRIVVVHQKNAGPSSARNKGLKIATGKFIEFVDADDFIEKDCVQTLANGIGDHDLAICGFEEKSKKTETLCFEEDKVYHLNESASLFFEFVRRKLISTIWNKLYLKEKISCGFNDKYFIGEDVIFNLKYLENCKSVAAISKVLYHYNFTNQNSIMHTKVRTSECFLQYWDEIYAFCNKFFAKDDYLRFLNGHFIRAVMLQIMNETIKNAYGFKDYKKLFTRYRQLPKVKAALKNCHKNFLRQQKLFAFVLILVFKLKFKFTFYVALKIFKIKRYGRKNTDA